MNNRTVHRGASARFLAALASSTMVVAGLAGVTAAGPASADEDVVVEQTIELTPQQECEAQTDKKWIGGDGPNGECVDKDSPGQSGEHKVTICHRHASIQNPYNVETIDKDSIADGYKFKWLDGHGEWNHQGPVFNPAIHTKSGGSKDDPGSQWGDIIPPFVADDGTEFEGYNWSPEGQAIWENDCRVPGYEPPVQPTASASAVCNVAVSATVTANGYSADDLSIVVTVDGAEVVGTWTDGVYTYSQALSDKLSHSISVTVSAGEETFPGASASNGSCTPPPDDLCPDMDGLQTTYPYANDSCTPPPADNPPAPQEVTPVVEAAVASVPEAAAIAPAPATVSVPAAAKLPAAVPAGDGSEAPRLPLWALALMVVGLLGAGFSARSWAASRK